MYHLGSPVSTSFEPNHLRPKVYRDLDSKYPHGQLALVEVSNAEMTVNLPATLTSPQPQASLTRQRQYRISECYRWITHVSSVVERASSHTCCPTQWAPTELNTFIVSKSFLLLKVTQGKICKLAPLIRSADHDRVYTLAGDSVPVRSLNLPFMSYLWRSRKPKIAISSRLFL